MCESQSESAFKNIRLSNLNIHHISRIYICIYILCIGKKERFVSSVVFAVSCCQDVCPVEGNSEDPNGEGDIFSFDGNKIDIHFVDEKNQTITCRKI